MTGSTQARRVLPNVAWVVGTTIGLVVCGFIFHFPGSFGEYSWEVVALVFGAILGFTTGVAVGLVQWACLALRRRAGLRLLLWMGIGNAVTHGLNDGAPWSLGIVAVSLLSGIGMAVAYVVCLDDRRPMPIVLVGFGWTAGLVLASLVVDAMGLPWEETQIGWSMQHAVSGVVVGLVWGGLTVLAGIPARLRANIPTTSPSPVASDLAPSP